MSATANTFDLESKLNRAIYATIISTGAGKPGNTFAGYVDSENRPIPNTTIISGEGEEEYGLGNYRFFGKIIFRDSATLQPEMSNPRQPFLDAQNRTSSIISQLVQSDGSSEMEVSRSLINSAGRAMAIDPTNGANQIFSDLALVNADMVDFTIIYWRIIAYGSVKSTKSTGNTNYERETLFEALCCNSNVD